MQTGTCLSLVAIPIRCGSFRDRSKATHSVHPGPAVIVRLGIFADKTCFFPPEEAFLGHGPEVLLLRYYRVYNVVDDAEGMHPRGRAVIAG